jgi:phage internal scaffolding protein
MKPKILKRYENQRSQVKPVGDSLTQQHFTAEADIKNIIRKHDREGLIANVNRARAMYGDFTEVNEYAESLNTVIRAQEAFMELPSDIRAKFKNDPGSFLEFVTNDANKEQMYELGLAQRPIVEEPISANVEGKKNAVAPPVQPEKAAE